MYRAVSVETGDRHRDPETGYLTRCFLLEAAAGPINAEVPRHPVRWLSDSDPRRTPETIEVAWRNLELLRDEGLVKIDARLSIPPVLLKPLVLGLAHASGVKHTFGEPADDDPGVTGYPASWMWRCQAPAFRHPRILKATSLAGVSRKTIRRTPWLGPDMQVA